jgi:hypothetical protein
LATAWEAHGLGAQSREPVARSTLDREVENLGTGCQSTDDLFKDGGTLDVIGKALALIAESVPDVHARLRAQSLLARSCGLRARTP